jgi:type I restriction enzyme S subunit
MSLTVEVGHQKNDGRFLQEGWQKKRLSEISEIVNGYSFRSEDFSPNNSIQSVKITNVGVREFIQETSSLLPEEFLDKYSSFKVFKGDIVIALTRSIISNGLKAALVPDEYNEALLNQRVAAIKPNRTDIIERFLFFYFCTQNVTEYVKQEANTLMQPNLSIKSLKNLLVPIPPLPEQNRIVAILDEAFEGIDRAIANTEKNLANSRELFESYLNAIFTQKGDGWVEKKLGDIATFRNGLNFTKSSKGESIKIVGVKDFQNHFWIQEYQLDSVTIDADLKEIDILRKGDILTVRSNGNKELIGRCILADDISEKISHSGFTIRIRIESEDIYPQFIVYSLKSRHIRKQLIESGCGINISSLNQQGLSLIKLSFPTFVEQKAIVANIDELAIEAQRLEAIYRKKLAALNELKQSILQKAFTGELTADTPKTVKEEIAA